MRAVVNPFQTGQPEKNVKLEANRLSDSLFRGLCDRTKYEYDGAGRPWATNVPDPTFSAPSNTATTQTYYDAAGNLIKSVNHMGQETEIEYDYLNRAVKTDIPIALVVENGVPDANEHKRIRTDYNPDGSVEEVRDALGDVEYAYDNLGRVLAQDAKGADSFFTYNVYGFRTSVTDPNGNTTLFVPDELGRLMYEHRDLDLDGFKDDYEYREFGFDAFGNLVYKQDRRGWETIYERDNLGRVTDETWWEGAFQKRGIGYDYSTLGQLTWANDSGHLNTSDYYADGESTYFFTYDALQNLYTSTFEKDGDQIANTRFVYDYDLRGTVENVTSTSGGTIDLYGNMSGGTHSNETSYGWDIANRIQSIEQTGSGSVYAMVPKYVDFAYGYDATDNTAFSSITRYEEDTILNSTHMTAYSEYYSYADGRPAGFSHWDGLDPATRNEVLGTSLTYNEDGLIYSHEKSSPDLERLYYSYDATGQLTSTEQIRYDEQGNPQSNVQEFFDYDANGNKGLTGAYNQVSDDAFNHYEYDVESDRVTVGRRPLGYVS